jgi:F-type H+-transporting ATPase subunit alpha
LAAFAQFASDLDDATRKQLEHGQRVTELMKQKQYSPLSVGDMAMTLFVANEGHLDDVPADKVVAFEEALIEYFRANAADLKAKIDESGAYSDDIAKELETVVTNFKSSQTW